MKSKKALLWVVSSLAFCASAVFGAKYLRKKIVARRVFAALCEEDSLKRLEALAHLRDSHHAETARILVGALDHPDNKIRCRAASFLPTLRIASQIANVFLAHLQNNSSPRVRLSCAVALMSVETMEAKRAYIRALHDAYEKVVQIACAELGWRGGADATEALFQTLSHPSWNVRLEVCKALITCKVANQKVVSVLEAMMQEPEAVEYDTFVEETDQLMEEVLSESEVQEVFGQSWGKIETILQQARQVAQAQ